MKITIDTNDPSDLRLAQHFFGNGDLAIHNLISSQGTQDFIPPIYTNTNHNEYSNPQVTSNLPIPNTDSNIVNSLYQAFNNHTQIGIILTDLEGNIRFANQGACLMLGYDEYEIKGLPNFLYLFDSQSLYAELERLGYQAQNLAENGFTVIKQFLDYNIRSIYELQVVHKNGYLYPVEAAFGAVEDSNGLKIGTSIILRDIFQYKKLEIEVKEREQRLRRQDKAVSALAKNELLTSGNVEEALKAITEILASTVDVDRASIWLIDDASTKITCVDLFVQSENIHNSGVELFAKDFPSYFEALKSQTTIAAHDAHTHPATFEFSGPYLSVLGIGALLDIPIWLRGKMIGVICHEHVGSARNWLTDEQNFATAVADLISLTLESKERIELIELLKKKEDELSHINQNLQQVVEERTQALEDLKNAQEKLINSEKLAVLGQLVAGVAHEMNTPLGAIKASARNLIRTLPIMLEEAPQTLQNLNPEETALFSELVKQAMKSDIHLSTSEERTHRTNIKSTLEKIGVDEPIEMSKKLVKLSILNNIERYAPILLHNDSDLILESFSNIGTFIRNINNIDLAVEKSSRVVQALKTYSHVQSNEEMVMIDLEKNIDTTLTIYENMLKQGIKIVKNYKNTPLIKGYPDELGQVWTNIIVNSVHAMNNSGQIIIEIDKTINADNKEWVNISFTDNGPGIPSHVIDKIFDPFFTTKAQGEGTGMGLDISRKIIQKHSGNIAVDTIPGRTTFIINLPIDN